MNFPQENKPIESYLLIIDYSLSNPDEWIRVKTIEKLLNCTERTAHRRLALMFNMKHQFKNLEINRRKIEGHWGAPIHEYRIKIKNS